MRRIAARDTNVQGCVPGMPRTAPGESPHGAFRRIAAMLDAMRRWWAAGRRYHPEKRYMRGGRPTTPR